MPLLLLIQAVFYDRPRLFKQLKAEIKSKNDLKSYVVDLHSNDPFKAIALGRLKSLVALKTLPSPNTNYALFWLLDRSEIENLQTQ